jgi:GT2 family glycosyltransferase
MKLSIIIVSWNTKDLLRSCLESINQYPPGHPYEVFVVDNVSTDGSIEMVVEDFPQVQLIANKTNVGFAGGNNQAISQSVGDYILLLNPDTEVKPGALDALIDFLDETPEAGVAGAKLLNPDGSLQESCYPKPTLIREFWRLFYLDEVRPYARYKMARWDQKKPKEVDVLMGACMLLRREIIEAVGLFDVDYFIYSEEVDLCIRIQKAGWSLHWIPQAEVVHYGGQSTQQLAAEMFLQLYKGKIMFFRKHSGWLAVLLYKVILLMAAMARLMLAPLAWFGSPSRRKHYLTLTNHYRRLLTALPGM